MRDEKTHSKEFRESINEIASFMCFEVFKDLKTHESEETYNTPTGYTLHRVKLDDKIIIVPILRAGIGLCDGIKNMIPTARIGHIGMYRNEETLEPVRYYCKLPKNITLEPVEYYFKLPEVNNPLVLIVDPMLATGGSAVAAITACKKRGYTNIRLMCLVGVPQGVEAVEKAHPDVHIYLASLDEKLNEKGYIIPGLGDAGDRIFGTK